MFDLFFDLWVSLIGFGYFQYGRKTRQASFVGAGIGLIAVTFMVSGIAVNLILAGAIGAAPFVIERLT